MKSLKLIVPAILLLSTLISCQSKEEQENEAMEDESIDLISSALADLIVDQVITIEHSNEIQDEYRRIADESPEKGLEYAEFIKSLSRIEGLTNEEFEIRLSTFSEQGGNQTITEEIDFSKFNYYFPKSEEYHEISITDIQVDTIKDAFEVKTDEYSPREKKDGLILKIYYSMTNPYDKEMLSPIYHYATISSLNDEFFTQSTTLDRDRQCQIDNQTKTTTLSGETLYEISDGECGGQRHCVLFQPKETKEFVITFTDPFLISVRKLVFSSFNMSWNGGDDNVTGNDNIRDRGLIIDIDKLEIVGEKRY